MLTGQHAVRPNAALRNLSRGSVQRSPDGTEQCKPCQRGNQTVWLSLGCRFDTVLTAFFRLGVTSRSAVWIAHPA